VQIIFGGGGKSWRIYQDNEKETAISRKTLR
jgi:hypothetical protein